MVVVVSLSKRERGSFSVSMQLGRRERRTRRDERGREWRPSGSASTRMTFKPEEADSFPLPPPPSSFSSVEKKKGGDKDEIFSKEEERERHERVSSNTLHRLLPFFSFLSTLSFYLSLNPFSRYL